MAREIDDYNQRIDRARAWAEGITQHPRPDGGISGGMTSDKVGDGAIELAEIEEMFADTIRRYRTHIAMVDEAIDDIPDANQRRVLRLRYMDGLLWTDIAKRTKYDERSCYRHHDAGLEALGIKLSVNVTPI